MIYEYTDEFKLGNNKVALGFKCTYDKDFNLCYFINNIQFDSHDLRIKINKIVNEYDKINQQSYESKYGNITILALAMYLFDNIDEIEYVKFIKKDSFDILYKTEVLKMLSNN